MITDKLTIYGDKEDVRLIKELLCKCADTLDVKAVPVAVYAMCAPDDATVVPKGAEWVVADYKDRELIGADLRKVTYSVDNSCADVVALNVQQRELHQCFEILHGVFMSRVFIPLDSAYTREQILVCATVLSVLGAPMDKIIPAINESLK